MQGCWGLLNFAGQSKRIGGSGGVSKRKYDGVVGVRWYDIVEKHFRPPLPTSRDISKTPGPLTILAVDSPDKTAAISQNRNFGVPKAPRQRHPAP